MSVFGVDYAWGRPGVSALRAAGVKFVCRYLSHDTTGKNLTAAEAASLSAAGIWVVVVWESTASRALGGHVAGAADARAAASQARACGMPDGRPIYFAVDFDAVAAQQPAIDAYLDGAASVLGRARVGLYAGYAVIKRAFDDGKITWGWQTYAWSGGRWDRRAHLQQYRNDQRINGVGLDYDRATADDYGQWRVGVTPSTAEDEDMDPSTVFTIPPYWRDPKRSQFSHDKYRFDFLVAAGVSETRAYGKAMLAQLAAQQATIDRLVDAVAAGPGVNVEALKAEIRQVVGDAVAGLEIHLDVEPATEAVGEPGQG